MYSFLDHVIIVHTNISAICEVTPAVMQFDLCNSRLACYGPIEMQELAEHGTLLPPNMQGLTEEQLVDLKLKDEWEDKCVPSGGPVLRKDEYGRRNGHGER